MPKLLLYMHYKIIFVITIVELVKSVFEKWAFSMFFWFQVLNSSFWMLNFGSKKENTNWHMPRSGPFGSPVPGLTACLRYS